MAYVLSSIANATATSQKAEGRRQKCCARRSISALCFLPSALPLSERLVQVIEQGKPPFQAGGIVRVCPDDAGDQLLHARGLRTFVLAVAQVDVVHDLADAFQGAIAQGGRGEEDLERTAAGVVGDVAAGH